MENSVESTGNARKRFKPLIIGLAALLVVAAAIAAYFIISAGSKDYAVRIGNEKVQSWEFNFYLKQVKDGMLATAQQKDPKIDEKTFWSTKYQGEDPVDYAKKQALDLIKNSKVQLIKAKEAKTVLTKDQQDSINNYETTMAQQNGTTKDEVIKQITSTYGITMDQFKTFLKEKYLISVFQQNEIAKITSPPDVKTYYAQNPNAFIDLSDYRPNGEEAVWVRHILIMTTDQNGKPLPQDQQDAALKKAQDILAKAKNGEDFASLAKQYSQDPGSAQYGGDYVFAKGYMDPAFENAAFSLQPGQITQDLVKTSYGYHIIKLEEKIPAGKPVSLNCATQYREFGETVVKQGMYLDEVKKWEGLYKIDINQSVYNSIK